MVIYEEFYFTELIKLIFPFGFRLALTIKGKKSLQSIELVLNDLVGNKNCLKKHIH